MTQDQLNIQSLHRVCERLIGARTSGPVSASPTCTKEPQQKWLSEDVMKKKIADLGYKEIKAFKTTTSGCYEIYGHRADGKRAEVYFNPVDGSIV